MYELSGLEWNVNCHRNLWNCHLMWGVRSARTWSAKWWSHTQSWAFRAGISEIAIWWGGGSVRTWSAKWLALRVGMKYAAVTAEICRIAIWQGVDLPTLGLPNMSSQSRAGISEIAFDEVGRSANTWSAKCWALRVEMKYEFHSNLWNCHLMGG